MSDNDTIPYKAIESAIAKMCGADDGARYSTLRARMDFLKRARTGALGAERAVGKGNASRYSRDQADRLALGIELEEFGIGPADIGGLYATHWPWLRETLRLARAATGEHDETLLILQPGYVSAVWRGESPLPALGRVVGRRGYNSIFDALRMRTLNESAYRPGTRPRVSLINLSTWASVFDGLLAEALRPAPPSTEEMGGAVLAAINAAARARGQAAPYEIDGQTKAATVKKAPAAARRPRRKR